MLPTIPKDLIHITQPHKPRHHRLHPLDHARLIELTPLSGITRRRQLRDPDALRRPAPMQCLQQPDDRVRIRIVDMHADDADLAVRPIDALAAGIVELAQPVAVREGDSGRDELRRCFCGQDGLEGFGGVLGRGEGREAHVGEVGFVEEFEIGGWVGSCDHDAGFLDFAGVHADFDLGVVEAGAGGGGLAVDVVGLRLVDAELGEADCGVWWLVV